MCETQQNAELELIPTRLVNDNLNDRDGIKYLQLNDHPASAANISNAAGGENLPPPLTKYTVPNQDKQIYISLLF